MDAHLPQLARCTNRFERYFVLLCERHGLPIPDPNERIGRYRPDMLWREARLIVELDGHDAHRRPPSSRPMPAARPSSRPEASRWSGSLEEVTTTGGVAGAALHADALPRAGGLRSISHIGSPLASFRSPTTS